MIVAFVEMYFFGVAISHHQGLLYIMIMTKWLLHWFASYSIQYFGTSYTELRPRSLSIDRCIYGYIISSTPMPESQWLSGKSV